MDGAALIDHESRSVSEIPLVRRISGLSSASDLSPPREPAASNPSTSASGGDNAAVAGGEPVRAMRSGPPPATAAATTDEDVSKLDLAIMAFTTSLLVFLAITIGGLGWETRWKVPYGSLIMLSFLSTATGFLTAWRPAGPAVWWARTLSPSCARLGLLLAAPLFVVFIACKVARLGCVAGVAVAAVVVVFLAVVWILMSMAPAVEQAAGGVSGSLTHEAP